MDFVTCPNCGQVQARAEDGKCIKCGETIPAFSGGHDPSGGDGGAGVQRCGVCPSCGFVQSATRDQCQNCHGTMYRKNPAIQAASIACLIVGLLLLAGGCVVLFFALTSDRLPVGGGAALLAAGVVLVLLSGIIRAAAKKKETKILEELVTSYGFAGAEGINGIGLSERFNMRLDLDQRELLLQTDGGLPQAFAFSQIIDVETGEKGKAAQSHADGEEAKAKRYVKFRYRPADGLGGERTFLCFTLGADTPKALMESFQKLGIRVDSASSI